MSRRRFRIILSDIGGVLGTNGWDSTLRIHVCEHFGLDPDAIEPRHRLMFDSYERGYIGLTEYLRAVFFSLPRTFTLEAVRDLIYEGSVPWGENIEFFRAFRQQSGLKLGLVSNEGEGIAHYRVETFGLRELADFMVVSHFTRLRKPDPEIWRLALNLAGAAPDEAVYIDDRAVFAEAAAGLGLTGIHYQDLPQLRHDLAALGLPS